MPSRDLPATRFKLVGSVIGTEILVVCTVRNAEVRKAVCIADAEADRHSDAIEKVERITKPNDDRAFVLITFRENIAEAARIACFMKFIENTRKVPLEDFFSTGLSPEIAMAVSSTGSSPAER
jgi:hypothetical protein